MVSETSGILQYGWGRTDKEIMEYWSVGVLECWSSGVLEGWSTGVLFYLGHINKIAFFDQEMIYPLFAVSFVF